MGLGRYFGFGRDNQGRASMATFYTEMRCRICIERREQKLFLDG